MIHYGLKLQPNILTDCQPFNAAHRISAMFTELLERQFPIEDNHPKIALRTASDYAEHLNVHVNHLNRAVKEVTGKTTSQVVADRLIQEAKVLLKHSNRITLTAEVRGMDVVTEFTVTEVYHKEDSDWKMLALTFSSVWDTHEIQR